MKVYVVEQGCYAERWVVGVYASPEAAMEGRPQSGPNQKPTGPGDAVRPGGWLEHDDDGTLRRWSNGLDWDLAIDVTEYEVE